MTRENELATYPRAEDQGVFRGKHDEITDLPDDNEVATAVAQEAPKGSWHRRMLRASPVMSMMLGWSVGILVVLFLAFIVFGILYSGIHYRGAEWHVDPSACVTPFGAILGVHNGVFAYSNCNEEHFVDEWNAIAGQAQQKTGIKWQCVEYARRYWMLSEKPASFGDVEGASDIWSLETVQLQDGSTAPLQKFPNGQPSQSGGSAPLAGDLLIYPKQGGGFPFGHVAVIVRVGANSVFVAEQNWGNKLWPGPHHEYAREIPMQHDAQSGAYTINEVDGDIVTGWVRYTA